MNQKTINEIFYRFSQAKPKPQIELNYQCSYTLLVAVILSAQSTDKGVNRATTALFDIANTPEKMVLLGEEKLKTYIKTIGLFNNKAKNIIAMSEQLVKKHNSNVPKDFEALCALPGVGRKSANVVLNSFFGMPTMAVDVHVFRVSNRIGLCKTKTPLETEMALLKVIPKKWMHYAHHWLVLHGRYVCKARKPECHRCLINDLCEYYRATHEEI